MRLEDDMVRIKVDGYCFRCRPSLRAAFRLARQHGDLGTLLRLIVDGNATAMAGLIRETATTPEPLSDIIARTTAAPLHTGLAILIPALIDLTLALAGVDPDAISTNETTEHEHEQKLLLDQLTRLYQIGTGHLGWTPETTWNATPAEILAAYEGRVDLLRMIFGSSETPGDTTGNSTSGEPRSLDDKFKAAFSILGTKRAA